MQLKWWAYRHTNGQIFVKRFFSEDQLDDAFDSPFVEDVAGPWECSRAEATQKATRALKVLKSKIKSGV